MWYHFANLQVAVGLFCENSEYSSIRLRIEREFLTMKLSMHTSVVIQGGFPVVRRNFFYFYQETVLLDQTDIPSCRELLQKLSTLSGLIFAWIKFRDFREFWPNSRN